jgi:cytosine/adenosine deaminase-related metal-dependent hydrolase
MPPVAAPFNALPNAMPTLWHRLPPSANGPLRQVALGQWVFPMHTPPLAWGVVVREGDTLHAVLPQGEVPPSWGPLPWEHAQGVLLAPPLINAHTHLELTFDEPIACAENDFLHWLGQVVALLQQPQHQSAEAINERCQRGLAQLQASGTRGVGDIARGPHSAQLLKEAGYWGAVVLECFHPQRWEEDPQGQAWVQAQAQRLQGLQSTLQGQQRLRDSLSPHSPYNVHASAWHALAQAHLLPFTHTHVGESEAEMAFFKEAIHSPLAQWQEALLGFKHTAHHWAQGLEPTAYPPLQLAAHGLQLSPAAISAWRQAHPNLHWVVCPSSQQWLHGRTVSLAQWEAMAPHVCLGTDSPLSLPQGHALDVRAEAAVLHEVLGLSWEALLAACTLQGAKALGLEGHVGALSAGHEAEGVTSWRLPPASHHHSPAEALAHWFRPF